MKFSTVRSVALLIWLFVECSSAASEKRRRSLMEDAKLNFMQLGRKYGYNVKEHEVVTEDGYVLKLFNVPGNKSNPVLLVHGVADCSDTFLLRGNTSLVITLARQGYDVWLANSRGNKYSRRHMHLNPDRDPSFWDYTFHELGTYDLPAIIDYILEQTGQKQLSAVAMSQGNTSFYVLGSMRPEYNGKIKIMIALAPIAFLHNIRPPLADIMRSGITIGSILSALGQEELLADRSALIALIRMLCTREDISYALCGNGLLFPLSGADPEELEPEFFPVIMAHYPSSTSRKSGVHLSQVGLRKKFSQFDYGLVQNRILYKSRTPPDYELNKVTMNIALLAAKNDEVSSLKDVAILKKRLPNVVEYHVMEHDKWNHLDYVWGLHMKKFLFPHILRLLEKYN